MKYKNVIRKAKHLFPKCKFSLCFFVYNNTRKELKKKHVILFIYMISMTSILLFFLSLFNINADSIFYDKLNTNNKNNDLIWTLPWYETKQWHKTPPLHHQDVLQNKLKRNLTILYSTLKKLGVNS